MWWVEIAIVAVGFAAVCFLLATIALQIAAISRVIEILRNDINEIRNSSHSQNAAMACIEEKIEDVEREIAALAKATEETSAWSQGIHDQLQLKDV